MKTTFSSFVHAQGGRGELLERGGEAAGHGQGRHHRSGSLHRTGHVQLLGMLHVTSECSCMCTYEGIQKQMPNNSWTIPTIG